MGDIYVGIEQGRYDNKKPEPTLLPKPRLLRLAAGELSDDEIASLPRVKSAWKEAQDAYASAQDAHRAETIRLQDQFWSDVYSCYGVASTDPFVIEMRSTITRQAIRNWDEMRSLFEDLMPLYEIYLRRVIASA